LLQQPSVDVLASALVSSRGQGSVSLAYLPRYTDRLWSLLSLWKYFAAAVAAAVAAVAAGCLMHDIVVAVSAACSAPALDAACLAPAAAFAGCLALALAAAVVAECLGPVAAAASGC